MNKKIKLLADKASDYAGDRYNAITPLPDWNEYEPTWQQDYTEHLAQLVVAECIRLNEQDLSVETFTSMTKIYCKHFGIK
jgi:hypothetical protein